MEGGKKSSPGHFVTSWTFTARETGDKSAFGKFFFKKQGKQLILKYIRQRKITSQLPPIVSNPNLQGQRTEKKNFQPTILEPPTKIPNFNTELNISSELQKEVPPRVK